MGRRARGLNSEDGDDPQNIIGMIPSARLFPVLRLIGELNRVILA